MHLHDPLTYVPLLFLPKLSILAIGEVYISSFEVFVAPEFESQGPPQAWALARLPTLPTLKASSAYYFSVIGSQLEQLNLCLINHGK